MDTLRHIVSGFVLAALVLAAIGFAFYGGLNLTQMTLGVGGIAIAIFIAILARIAQAADHHVDILRAIEKSSSPKP